MISRYHRYHRFLRSKGSISDCTMRFFSGKELFSGKCGQRTILSSLRSKHIYSIDFKRVLELRLCSYMWNKGAFCNMVFQDVKVLSTNRPGWNLSCGSRIWNFQVRWRILSLKRYPHSRSYLDGPWTEVMDLISLTLPLVENKYN